MATTTRKTEPTPDTPPAPTRPRNIVEALHAVMQEVRAVGKDGRNQSQNYNFRGIDGTVNALGPAMRKHGVIPMPELLSYEYGTVEVGKGRTQQAHAQVKVRYTFHYSNADGEMSSLSAEVPGESMDSGDKGTAKAMSVAFRIALLQTFAIPTDEPDPDEFSYERSEAVPALTAEEVTAATQWAAKQDDLAAAFQNVRDSFVGRDATGVTLTNKAGEQLAVPAYINYAEAVTREWRAEQARKEQDATAQGEPDPAQDARADTPTEPAQDARQNEQAARAASTPTHETDDEKALRLARTELEQQAEWLGVPVKDHVAPVLNKDGSLKKATLVKYIVSQRKPVVEALRKLGDPSMAEAYAAVAEAGLIDIERMIATVEAQEDQPLPATV